MTYKSMDSNAANDMARARHGDAVDHHDTAEEMANAMIPFEENMTKVFEEGWDCDDLARYMTDNSFNVETDNYGWVVCYLDLRQAPDGSLWKETG